MVPSSVAPIRTSTRAALFIEPDIEVDAVGPPVDVTLLAQIALTPFLVISFPSSFEPHDVGGRQTGSFLAQDRGQNCLSSEILNMAACASLHEEKAHRKAQEYSIPKACSIDDLINDPQIDIILNLTVPEVHAKFNLGALEAGKHAYSEKPLAAVLEDGQKIIIALAKSKGLQVGCAPDTFLGGRLQACRKAIDERPSCKFGMSYLSCTDIMRIPVASGYRIWHMRLEIGGRIEQALKWQITY